MYYPLPNGMQGVNRLKLGGNAQNLHEFKIIWTNFGKNHRLAWVVIDGNWAKNQAGESI